MIRFGIVSDVQYDAKFRDDPIRYPTLGIQKLTVAINEFNKHDLDFVINLGDTIDKNYTNFPPILEVFEKSKFPVWHVLGNHDFHGADGSKGFKAEALDALGMIETTRYYYKDIGDWRFVILDTNEVGVIECVKDTPEWIFGKEYLSRLERAGRVNAVDWNGAVGSDQFAWLEDVIDSATKKDMKCIVFAHHPIYPQHRENALNDDEILAALSMRSHVKAYISGHNHYGNYGIYNDLPCLTIEGMVDYKDKTAYAIAEIQDNILSIKGYGQVADRQIELR